MSKSQRISFVAEGKTDYVVLDALIGLFIGADDYVSTQIQPPVSEYAGDSGPLGGGWKGVLRWCEQYGEVSVGNVALANCDCLVVHVDADIADERELLPLRLSAPCPPPKDTCDNIRKHLKTLMGSPVDPKVVFCVPSQCTEAWVFAALHPELLPEFNPIGCRREVERLLIGKRDRLVRDHDGRARKYAKRYEAAVGRIISGWPNAVENCSEAEQFETDCRKILR